jgi:bacterioferritin-associated ferredoxin
MEVCCSQFDCEGCSGRVVCHCLQITEDVIRAAARTFELRTIKDVRQHTGAGDGCTACHRRLRQLLESVRQEERLQSSSSSPSPI